MSQLVLQKNLTERGMLHVVEGGTAVCNSQIKASEVSRRYFIGVHGLSDYLIRDDEVVGPVCTNCRRIVTGEMADRFGGESNA